MAMLAVGQVSWRLEGEDLGDGLLLHVVADESEG